jgi:nitrous oxidase accessory protein NosD
MYIFGSSGKQGNGLNIAGSEYVIPVVFNINGCGFVGLDTGMIYGNYVQGVTINQSNFTHVQTGISVPSGEIKLDQLAVKNSQIEAAYAGINLASGVPSTIVMGTLFIVDNGANGIVLDGCANCQFVGNSFASGGDSPSDGVAIIGSVSPSTLTGNTFTGMSNGIFIGASGAGANIQSNAYSGNTTDVGSLAPASANIIGGGSK